MIASMTHFDGVIEFPSKICPRKKCDLSVTAFMCSLSSTWWYLSNTSNSSCFVCDCMKTSPKYVMIILLRMSERKISHINDEKAAGPKESS